MAPVPKAVLAALWAISVAGCDANAAVTPGIYGNVRYIEEAGDLVGVEIAVHQGPEHIVEMTLCEGDCNWISTSTYQIGEGAIHFTFSWPTINGDGSSGAGTQMRLTARQDGQDLRIEGFPDGAIETLSRMRERRGLAVAEEAMKASLRDRN